MTRLAVTVVDYGAGNVTSLLNALTHLHIPYTVAQSPNDISSASCIIFPGVGTFKTAMDALTRLNYVEPLREYLRDDRPFLGICVGMQVLFAKSDESEGVEGLGVFPGSISSLDPGKGFPVPHIGWSDVFTSPRSTQSHGPFYFVHSFALKVGAAEKDLNGEDRVNYLYTRYGRELFAAGVYRGRVCATQFHPEKSGLAGLDLIKTFYIRHSLSVSPLIIKDNNNNNNSNNELEGGGGGLRREGRPHPRVIACMDVCENEQGDLVVTKGDSYNIIGTNAKIRNHGHPAKFARAYFDYGADELVFLNITAFQKRVLQEAPMLRLLRETSQNVFIPLTVGVGGGIREYTSEEDGRVYTALDVADEYFRAGADKVSIGSDAVRAAQLFYTSSSSTFDIDSVSIKQISDKYGKQAVVISIDPKRVYVGSAKEAEPHRVRKARDLGPHGEEYIWYRCTVSGGRVDTDMDVIQVCRACEMFGAGEILLNCIDRDGKGVGYDLELLQWVKDECGLPVIASSGAGCTQHFIDAFESGADACLAAGIFHRGEVQIGDLKRDLNQYYCR